MFKGLLRIRNLLFLLATLAALALFLANGCGDKYSLPSDLPPPDYTHGGVDTTYIQINPIWTSADGRDFNFPMDVFVGYDQFIYVCDTRNNRVVKLDVEGAFIESDSVMHPVAITQDRGLDLLVVAGDYETIAISGTPPDTVKTVYGNAVYRKKYFGDQGFQAVWRASSPYWEEVVHGRTLWHEAEFFGISASLDIDKEYFLADFRKNRIIRFGPNDLPIPPTLIEEGDGLGQTKYPSDLYSYEIAGQKLLVYAGTGALGVQVVNPANGKPVFGDTANIPPLVRFQARPPKDVAVDELSNFYVLLQDPDPTAGRAYSYYFYKFDRYGQPLLSFGSYGSGDRQFRSPSGLAYKNGVIYIADSGNNRILRFQLSTDARR
jgi:hypothetical protein